MEMYWSERPIRDKENLELELQKHQRELFELVKEEVKPNDWTPIGLEESRRVFGSARKKLSRECIAMR